MSVSDAPGLVLLEHVNVNVADWAPTQSFYEALGCEQAIAPPWFMNCGPHTQFHLHIEPPVQQWRGDVTIAYTPEGLASTRARLADFSSTEDGAGLDVMDDASGGILVRGTWGPFLLREGTPAEQAMAALPSTRPNTSKTLAAGVLGIVGVSLPVAHGSVAEVGAFYSNVMRFQTLVNEGEALITGGPVEGSQHIRFFECASGTVPADYNGDHFCIYVGDFEGCFERCHDLDLLYVNPRFTFLDETRTLDEARKFQAFRVMDVANRRSAKPLFTEEHEIRSRNHVLISLARSSL